MDAQVEVVQGVTRGLTSAMAPGTSNQLGELKRRRAKVHAKQSMAMAILGQDKQPGLLLRVLAAMGKAVDRDPEGKDMAMHLDVADRCLRALPWLLEKEGEAGESAGNALAQALRGHGGPIQIVFGQHFHGRDGQPLTMPGQAGQALPGDAGAGPIGPASQP